MIDQENIIEQLYSNGLATDRFVRMLNDTTQCYKFYWLDAIMAFLPEMEDVTFDALFNEMICASWYSVTEFHLRLGPTKDGSPDNHLEHAVHIIEEDPALIKPAGKQDVLLAIKRNEAKLKECKKGLERNVPYRLLSSFIDDISGSDKIWDNKGRLIRYINELNASLRLPYTVIKGRSFQKKIRIDPQWRKFLSDNNNLIRSWIRLKKIQYLQDRNPGVPGIIYKLEDDGGIRKLDAARKLWTVAAEASGTSITDAYTGNVLSNNAFALDHFVPWTYIANDELWNLAPISPPLNSAKGNRLPDWDRFFPRFADAQYCLYKTVFTYPILRDQFNSCKKDNLNAVWALESLYIENNPEERFKFILEQHLHPIYESAKLQGFRQWKY